ncbi:uncharacterized protein [Nothobranchius furzeri]|uniref:LOC107391381-like protein n=1 Tax=Nothobranchius furzeri TaxID=105023 RepID=A0A9D2XZH3_NOTFU|nr:putative LOC107391381-like protein [Nothobranchius furzeri]
MAGSKGSCWCDVFGAGCTILFVTAFPVVQITLGAVYLYECPVAPVLPVYVMVFGTSALLMTAMLAMPRLLCPGAPRPTFWTLLLVTLLLLFFIWFLVGSYQIYSIYPPNYDKNNITDSNSSISGIHSSSDTKLNLASKSPRLLRLNQTQTSGWTSALSSTSPSGELSDLQHCNRTLYLFAFWTNTLFCVMAGAAALVMSCLYCFMKCTDVFVQHLST